MRICIVYDCMFPHTIGGAERWYRSLAERLVDDGHEVTYLTLRQWDRGADPGVAGVHVRAVGPRIGLYTDSGRRRMLPPLLFGAGVLWELLRHGRRFDAIHTASFPYFSLLAAALVRPLYGYRLVVDWHEVWTRSYWREYLGRLAGDIGWLVQRLCVCVPQRAFCFSELHAGRLRREGLEGELSVLKGEYAGDLSGAPARPALPLVVFAGRMIPEKRVMLGLDAVVAAAQRIPGMRAVFFGEGPDRPGLVQAIQERGLTQTVSAPGFAPAEQVRADLGAATCMLLPSRREGYGMIVVEAAASATPSIVVAGEDNAATELIEVGVNGVIVRPAEPDAIADAIVRIHESGVEMRMRTERWFAANAAALSLDSSLATVLGSYGPATARAPGRRPTARRAESP